MAQIHSNVERIPNQTTLIDQNDTNNIYLGISKVAGAVGSAIWQIRKIVTSGGNISILNANGTAAYDKIWSNRASYSYS